jgi:hypothetical protein
MIILRYRFYNPINIFVNCDTFNNLESPVNLYIYYYNELVARTETEFADYQNIMNGSSSERIRKFRN